MLAAFIQIHYCWFIILGICILPILGAAFPLYMKLIQPIVILVVSKVKSQHVLFLVSLMTGNQSIKNFSYKYMSLVASTRYAPYFAAIIDILDHCVVATWGLVELDLNSSPLPLSGEKDGGFHHLANFLTTG